MSQLIAVDANALAALSEEVKRLHKRLDAVDIAPRPEWVTLDEAAATLGKHRRTVIRYVEAGELESQSIAGVRMVRLNLGA